MNSDPSSRVFVGPAGWSYADWDGIVYPKGLGSERLNHVAKLFSLIEINSSFYHSPRPDVTAGWVARVDELPSFRFTAKLVKVFTHDSEKTWTLKARDDFRDGLEPLREAGRLAALLVQFPWFFEASDAHLHRLSRIRKAFSEHRLVLEVRHRSWLESAWLEQISSLGYSFCSVDQPQAKTSIPLLDVVTGPLGYLRVHGRNAEAWFRRSAPVHEKYDYLYRDEELDELLQVAQQLQSRTEELYVVANNHYVGQGPANAIQIQRSLTGRDPKLPESLVKAFPFLERQARGTSP